MQYQLDANDIDLTVFDYGEIITKLSSMPLDYFMNIENFICMVWQKDFYEDDKFDYSRKNIHTGLIAKEDIPKYNDYLISFDAKMLEKILKIYLRKEDIDKLNIDFCTIYDCYVLNKNKNYTLNESIQISYALEIIFKDNTKIFMLENCIDCLNWRDKYN